MGGIVKRSLAMVLSECGETIASPPASKQARSVTRF
jgi:hypothetical protein